MSEHGAPTAVGSDEEAVAAWLGSILSTSFDPKQLHLVTPSGGGWSNDTWIVRADGHAAPVAVVRVQPQRLGMFADYDLGRQARLLAALDRVPEVPTPPLLDCDLDGTRLGRPAFVMGFVAGRAPSDDRPSFAESGWLFEATAAQQRRFYEGMLDALVCLHGLDVDGLDLGWLRAPAELGDVAAALDHLRQTWDHDRGPCWSPIIDGAFDQIAATMPRAVERSRCGLLWGDARPANVLCGHDSFELVALLDWELAHHGPPELDVAWLLEMNWMRIEGAGLAPLPGFLDSQATVAYYQQRSGRTLESLDWYRRYSALRVAVLMHRYLRAVVHAGRMPEEHRIFTDNVSTRRLADLLVVR